MSDTSTNYAITTLRRGGRSAAKVLAEADPLARSSDERDAAREAVRSDPGAALAVINQASAETGLTLAGRWRALETTVGLIGDDASASEMIPDHVRADDLVDILRAGGDLPSSAANVVPRDVVLAAIFGELAEGIDADTDADAFIQRVIVLERWAHNLKDRPDYAELLNEEVGDWSVKHLLVAGLALRHGIPIRGDDRDDVLGVDGFIPTGVLADVGLDTEDMDELLDQVRDFDLGEFDAGSVASAYATLARKREQFQQAAAYVAPQVGSDDDL